MPPSDPSEPRPGANSQQRLTTLEEKACFTDDLLEHLNQQVARQQDQINLLLREVQRLRQQQPAPDEPFRSLRDELPPHY